MTRGELGRWFVRGATVIGSLALVSVVVHRTMDLPPSDAQSLTAIVSSVEQKSIGLVQSVEYERDWWTLSGVWEITVCKEKCVKLYIDPKTGQERDRDADELEDELPALNMKGPSAIAKHFQDAKLGHITEIEFEHGAWHVKFREKRGLLGALQPTKTRVFEQTPVSTSKERLVPHRVPPIQVVPREPFRVPLREKLIRVRT